MIRPILLLSAALLCAVPARAAVDAGYDHWARGVAALSRGRSGSAIRSFRRAVNAEPDDAVYRNWLGSMYFDRGRWADAREQLVRASQLDPDKAWYYYLGKSNLELFWAADAPAESESARAAAHAAFTNGIRAARKKEWVDEMRRVMKALPYLGKSKSDIARLRREGDFVGAANELDRVLDYYPFSGGAEELEALNRGAAKQLMRERLFKRYDHASGAVVLLLGLALAAAFFYLLWYRRKPRRKRAASSIRTL